MVWQILILNGLAEILSAIILLAAIIFSFWLMKKDKSPKWNLILIAISFLALSVIFRIIEPHLPFNLIIYGEHIFMAISALIFASTLIFYTKRKPIIAK